MSEQRAGRRLHVIPPPLFWLACLVAGSLVQYMRPFPLAPYSFVSGMIAGSIVFLLAASIGLWAFRTMHRHRTPVEPWRDPVRLVTSGPFRFTRNPLYVSLTLTLAGLALMVNSAWLAGAAVLLPVLLDRFVVIREEAVLSEMFGQEYADYRERVRRWV